MSESRPRDAFRDWGDGYRSVSFLVTGRYADACRFHAEVGGEDFGRRKSTQRIRLFLAEGEAEAQVIKRLTDQAEHCCLTLQLLHGAGDSEWYELIYLARHGKRWGEE